MYALPFYSMRFRFRGILLKIEPNQIFSKRTQDGTAPEQGIN